LGLGFLKLDQALEIFRFPRAQSEALGEAFGHLQGDVPLVLDDLGEVTGVTSDPPGDEAVGEVGIRLLALFISGSQEFAVVEKFENISRSGACHTFSYTRSRPFPPGNSPGHADKIVST
jgi:hypothetical protein